MLRRYLILNLISTALMYGAYFSLVPSRAGIFANVSESVSSYSMESSMLAPLVYRIITVSGR
jgi:hypothetical protein